MVATLILSAVNAGLSMVWILAFNIYIALWTKATETSKSTVEYYRGIHIRLLQKKGSPPPCPNQELIYPQRVTLSPLLCMLLYEPPLSVDVIYKSSINLN